MRFVTVSLKSKFFKAAMVVALITGTSNFVNAQTVVSSDFIASNEPVLNNVVVNHISTADDKLVFNVRIPNTEGKKFTVIVKDIDGNTLFHNSYTEKNFNKKFQLPKVDDEKYKFIIKDDSGSLPQTFEVNSNVRFVEEVIVKKII